MEDPLWSSQCRSQPSHKAEAARKRSRTLDCHPHSPASSYSSCVSHPKHIPVHPPPSEDFPCFLAQPVWPRRTWCSLGHALPVHHPLPPTLLTPLIHGHGGQAGIPGSEHPAGRDRQSQAAVNAQRTTYRTPCHPAWTDTLDEELGLDLRTDHCLLLPPDTQRPTYLA